MDAVPPEVFQRLIAYDYPGNIRELENLVRRLIVLRDPRYILGELQTRPANAPSAPPLDPATTQSSGQLLPFPNEPSPYTNPSFTRPPPQPQQAVAPSQPMTYGYAPAPAPGSQPGMMTVSVPYETPNAPPGQIDDEYRIDLKDLGRKAANAAEREAIVIMLRHTGGNKREAAERLGISYKAILYKIREFGIGRPRNRRPAPLPAAAASLEADAVDALGDDDLDADDRPTTLSGTVNAAVGSIG
jgi:DNA-binding NtrC family response regulator